MTKTSTHFVRMLKTAQVKETVAMLNKGCGTNFAMPKAKDGRFEIKAPDGDIVFSGLYNGSVWLCRLHKEVFSQGGETREHPVHAAARAFMDSRPDLPRASLDEWLIDNAEHLTAEEIQRGRELLEQFHAAEEA